MLDVDAGEDARLRLGDGTVEIARASSLVHVLTQRRLLWQPQRRQAFDERVLRREHHIRRTWLGLGFG